MARVKRSIVAEMPHTIGIGGLDPGSPWMSRRTIVWRSAVRFMPRCASSRTMTRSVFPPWMVFRRMSQNENSRAFVPLWASRLVRDSFCVLRK